MRNRRRSNPYISDPQPSLFSDTDTVRRVQWPNMSLSELLYAASMNTLSDVEWRAIEDAEEESQTPSGREDLLRDGLSPEILQELGDGAFVEHLRLLSRVKKDRDVQEALTRVENRRRARAERVAENFGKWFGNSVVVGADGKPLVVFHGTNKGGFTSFSLRKAGHGFFFTSSRAHARSYAKKDRNEPYAPFFETLEDVLHDDTGSIFVEKTQDEDGFVSYRLCDGHGGHCRYFDMDEWEDLVEHANDISAETWWEEPGIYEVYLRMEDPLEVDALGSNWDSIPWSEEVDEDEIPYYYSTNELADIARDMGFDGLIVRNVVDSGSEGQGWDSPEDVYAVFNPEQIKSTHLNIGTFDPESDDIRRNPRTYCRRR